MQSLEYSKRGEKAIMATRNYNHYQYETSPRKILPEEPARRTKQKMKKSTALDVEKRAKEAEKAKKTQAKKHLKTVCYLVLGFAVLFAIGYRNSQINEAFTENQKIEKQISDLKKENEQLNVAIQNSLNLSQIEKEAKERLGMQKLTSRQTVYVDLPKKDYIEGASEEIIMTEEEKSWIDKFVDYIKKLF